jgi:arginyl-tRNA synthetase
MHTPLHRAAAQAMGGDVKVEAPPRADLGDLAAPCFQLAKARGKSPALVAQEIAAAFVPDEWLESATAAGPFVNFRARKPAAFAWVVEAALGGSLLPRALGTGKTITIDYGSPNISKHLAYHHIRGTTIGHSLAQTYRALGYRVVAINFLGDWGTTHGMVLAAVAKWGAPEPLTVDALNDLYVKFRKEPDAEDQGRAWLQRLEAGEPEATALWQRFREVSWLEFEEIYKILGIAYDDLNGESFFWREAERIADELRAKGFLVESEGAQVVHLDGEKNPILLLTKDGTTLYATRDVAAAESRGKTYHPEASLYVVDRGQATHFRQLFKLLAKMGYEWASRCVHVPYGLVRVGGKKTATRLGNVVLMREVFAIAEDEVRTKIAEVNPDLPADVATKVAHDVGIGAVIFANLAPQRDKDIDFDLEHAVSLDGDSGPYLQYSHARCASITRKAGEQAAGTVDYTRLAHDAEWAVARKLLEFPDAVVRAASAREPHAICHYLLALAAEFSHWYTLGNGDAALRVLVDDPAIRRARLALVAAVQATLGEGLSLLGIAAPDQM